MKQFMEIQINENRIAHGSDLHVNGKTAFK